MHQQQPLFLCLAQAYKGRILLEEARALGIRTLLFAHQSTRGQWAEETADEIFYFPDFSDRLPLCQAIAYLARTRRFEAVFPLDELSVEVAAVIREHLGLPGLDVSQAHRFRDKLLMRQAAEHVGISQPRFVAALNDQSLREFVARVAGPWYLKPRSLAGSAGIMRVENEGQLWVRLQELGEQRGFYLLEESIEGRVYHVDSLVYGHQIPFAQVHAYGDPPWRISQQGGVFTTSTVHPRDRAHSHLRTLNERVIGGLGLARGVVHAEFLERKGRFYFLEAAARVAGANIDVLVEKSSGLNLWRRPGRPFSRGREEAARLFASRRFSK
ncbi:MAG: ATPase [Candidatus Eremiobacteraeota bacterium]|nr:ATPase [Candidatus Eremiobacteraeota bacterium]MCW5871203.1 ATPase [Candidatus Eremiobacteraeota bacterium]